MRYNCFISISSGFVNYKKGGTRLTAASDKVCKLLAHGRWFSPGNPASSTTKTGRHGIAEILLKVALSTINQIKSISSEQQTVKQVSNGLRPIIRHPDSPVVRQSVSPIG